MENFFNIQIIDRQVKRVNWILVGYEAKIIINDYEKALILCSDIWDLENYQQQWVEGIERLKTHDTSCLIAHIRMETTGNPFLGVWNLYKVNNAIFINSQMFFYESTKKIPSGNPPYYSQSCYQLLEPRIVNEKGNSIDEDGNELWELSININVLFIWQENLKKQLSIGNKKTKKIKSIDNFKIEVINNKIQDYGAPDFGFEGKITIGHYTQVFLMRPDMWNYYKYEDQWQEGIERIKNHNSSCLIESIHVLPTGLVRIVMWKLYKVGNIIFFNRTRLDKPYNTILLGSDPYFSQICYELVGPRITNEKGVAISEEGYELWELSIDIDDLYESNNAISTIQL